MNKLLLNESPLVILPTLASKIGLNEAIFAQQFYNPKKNEQFSKNLNSINSTINKVICEKNKSINEYNIFQSD